MSATSPFQLKRVFILLLVGLAVLSATSGTGRAAGATRLHTSPSGRSSSASAFTCGTWNVVASPNPSSSTNILSDVAAVSASNVWAVGSYLSSSTGTSYQTLTLHWNGTSWSIVASPNASRDDSLIGVAAASTSDVWAVGYSLNFSTNVNQTLIEFYC